MIAFVCSSWLTVTLNFIRLVACSDFGLSRAIWLPLGEPAEMPSESEEADPQLPVRVFPEEQLASSDSDEANFTVVDFKKLLEDGPMWRNRFDTTHNSEAQGNHTEPAPTSVEASVNETDSQIQPKVNTSAGVLEPSKSQLQSTLDSTELPLDTNNTNISNSNKMSSSEKIRYEAEIAAGDLTQLFGINRHVYQPKYYRLNDLGIGFLPELFRYDTN